MQASEIERKIVGEKIWMNFTILNHFSYRLIIEKKELLIHEMIRCLEKIIEKISDEQMNPFVHLKIHLENQSLVTLNPLDHLPLAFLKAPIDPDMIQIGELTKEGVETVLEALEEVSPPLEGITAFATSDIEIVRVPELPPLVLMMMEFIVQEGVIHPTVIQRITDQMIHLFNRFYQDFTSENWRDCVTQIQETISALKNSALSEIVLNPRLIPSLQNARILFMKKVIGNRFPISEQRKTNLAINLLKSMDGFTQPKMMMKEFGKLAPSLVPMDLFSDEQRQIGEVLIDVLVKTFMAHVFFKVAFLEGEEMPDRPEDETTLFLMNLNHFFFDFQYGENQSIPRTLLKKAIEYQLPTLAAGNSLKKFQQLLLLQMTQSPLKRSSMSSMG